MVAEGHRAVLLFCVQLTGVETISIAGHIDPLYAETLSKAMDAGVEVLVWQAELSDQTIRLQRSLSFTL